MDDMFACSCGFKCVKSQLYKTDGLCPVCKKDYKRIVGLS